MFGELDQVDQHLLDDFQRDFPLEPHPFRAMARQLGVSEYDVLCRLVSLKERGFITRVGATVRPNTVGASTLAALSVPEDRIGEVAAIVGAQPGVNHSYLREHEWNLWFVVTAPDRETLADNLDLIRNLTGLSLLDLRLLRPFNIDLGFSLKGSRQEAKSAVCVDASVIEPEDRPILEQLSKGLEIVSRPFAKTGRMLGRSETDIIGRIATLSAAGVLSRMGVIVRHRAIGWKANAMVVWEVPLEDIEKAGTNLASYPGITLCYQRNTVPGLWSYTLFSMIHARSRGEALDVLNGAKELEGLRDVAHTALFSTRCFKQTGALIESKPVGKTQNETYTVARHCA